MADRQHFWIHVKDSKFNDERCHYCKTIKRSICTWPFAMYQADGKSFGMGYPKCEPRPTCECGEPKRWLGRWCRPEGHTVKRHPKAKV